MNKRFTMDELMGMPSDELEDLENIHWKEFLRIKKAKEVVQEKEKEEESS